ncbi:MAG: hypothetical protein AAFP78_12580, partial [Pseudomonadota bacterium]
LHDEAVAWRRARIDALLTEREPLKLFLRLICTETAAQLPMNADALNRLIARSWELDRAARKGRPD